MALNVQLSRETKCARRPWLFRVSGPLEVRLSRLFCIVPLLSAFLVSGSLGASTLSYTGTFTQDDQGIALPFIVDVQGTAVLSTLGYAGGVNLGGTTIAAGGFDPVLSLFDSTGFLIALNNASIGFDSLISIDLSVGSYTLFLTESDNLPVGPTLADGFTRTGQGNFTGPTFAGVPGAFWDATPEQRNGNWAVDLVGVSNGVSPTPVPEPGSLTTFGFGFLSLGIGIYRGRRRSSATVDSQPSQKS
jgi:hypothetical protein